MFNEIFKSKLNLDRKTSIVGLNKKVQATYVWNFFSVYNLSLLIVTNTLYEANSLYKELLFYSEKDVLLFPMDDFLVSEAIAISPDLMVKRIETLNSLINDSPKIIITNLMGYLRFLPSKDLWKSLAINLKKEEVSRDQLLTKLNQMGYEKTDFVSKSGEYANRGYILDMFPYGVEQPIRIEFFDNVIEEIRKFDIDTQLSIEKLEYLDILPFTEFINEKNITDIPSRQSLLPKVVNKVSKLDEYLKNKMTFFINLDDIKLAYENLLKEIIEFRESDVFKDTNYMHDLIKIIPNNYVDIRSVNNYIKNSELVDSYYSSEIDQFNGNFARLKSFIEKQQKLGKKVIISLENEELITDFVSKIKMETIITSLSNIKEDYVNIIKLKICNGFIVNDYVFLTSLEIYGKINKVIYKNKFKYGTKIKSLDKLKIGDYVVHFSHGIGRYAGIVTLESKGIKKDYIYLQYKGNDKLYIPVEKIELISKYSSNEGAVPKLNKLNGTEWAKQKAGIKGKIRDIAKELLEISAKRKLLPGFAFLPDDKEQYDFENDFNYQETKDQLKVIDEIKYDMEKPYPMDRLLCGDVGYGKTEVAFRAIFKAIKSGKQVAFLCPTTILSKQHYENAINRFMGYGVNIEVLNRFVTSKKKKEILKNVESGKVDLLIGTHRLLSKDIKFKDLGLLVIDEEQRFGVTHKEKIKKLKNSIDVLTLSATPIPRTLQMSLTGVRGLSLIETPPVNRYPVQTYVLRENKQVIKDAIYKELARNGQVFVLYNNVSRIEEKVYEINALVPEARITYVHGQMSKNQIEDTMEEFTLGNYDVLVCTTIIETGIDIQNANTLIVIDADCFGLSQLYQIRGRIGRGSNIAYAYLMYNKNKELSDIATKRLSAIKEFTELGSGYALAVRDLAIRGAGDILGAQQSGFIDSVGYDMYIKILNEEVERLKGNKVEEDEVINERPLIQVATHISDKYADSEDIKIEIHKKINTIDSKEKFESIRKELEDRFGRLDESIIVYMMEELFEIKAKKSGVLSVQQNENNITVIFQEKKSENINGAKLLSTLFKINQNFKVNYVGKLLKISLNIRNLPKHFMYYLLEMIDIFE